MNFAGLPESPEKRAKRLNRLKTAEGQVKYLTAFIKIMDVKFSFINWNSDEEKLRFYATAYNSGYKKSAQNILWLIPAKSFYTSLLPAENFYCYSDIAFEFYSIFNQ